MTSAPTPSPIDAIGLADILHQPVRAVRFAAIDDSRGRMSEVSRWRVEYDSKAESEGAPESADRPGSVIVKRTVAEDLGHELRMAEREHGMFTDFSRVTDTVAVRCFASSLSADGDEGLLVLEDVSGSPLPTQHEGADDASALAIVEALARAHAETWNLPRSEVPSWCPVPDSEILLRQVDLAQRLWPEFAERHAAYLPERGMRIAERLLDDLPTLLGEWAEGSPLCILHGDVRLDNVLLDASGRVRLIDWQLAWFGPPAADLAHVLGGSLDVAAQRRSWSRLLDAYAAALAANGVPDYLRAGLHDDVGLALALVLPLNVRFGADADPDDLARREVLTRYITAIADHAPA